MRRKLIIQLTLIVVVAVGGLLANLLSGNHPSLGLDLQGGISVTQVPVGKYDPASLDLAVERIRERVDSLGVAEPEIIRQGNAIVINLPGVKNQQQALDLVKVTGQVYLRPVTQCVAGPDTSTSTTTPSGASTTAPATTVADSATTVAPTTPASADVTTAGSAGFKRPAQADTTIPPTTASPTTAAPTTSVDPNASTTSVDPNASSTSVDPNAPTTTVALDPTQAGVLPLQGGGQCYVGASGGTGEVFQNNASADLSQGRWIVTVSLRSGSEGEGVWNRLAAQCYGAQTGCESRQLAIELDGLIISAPTVNQPSFSGSVEISGTFTEREARNLARVLKSGSLPVTLQPQAVQTVSPTLGKDSLRAAIVSGLVGVGLVVLFMLFYYRALAWVVIGGIIISGGLLWSAIALLSKTQGLALSLSGIAGIIVSVGVTVDSYVVFFERLKDEVRAGRTMRNSAQRAFTSSWHTILVADLVSLMGAAVLWYLTVGSVRGFAFFLGLSTLTDLVVAYYFMRPAVLLAARTQWFARRKVMGIEPVAVDTLAKGAS
jgi:preprotein translocase subunit SecD